MNRWMACAMAGMLAATTAGAAPFQAADIAADAGWFAHVDLDLLKTTEVGEYVMSKAMAPEAERKLAAFASIFGFDPRRDVASVSAYGRNDRPKQGIILIRARLDSDRLVTLLRVNDTYWAATNGGYVVHSWLDDNKRKAGKTDRTFGAFHGNGIAVMGSSDDDVRGALEVLDAKRPSLAGSPRLSAFGPAPAEPVLAVMLDASAKGQMEPRADILKLARRASLTVGEAAGLVRARLLLDAPDAGTAAEMAKIADGMRSMMILNRGKDSRAANLAQGANVSANGAQMTVTLDYPATELIKDAEQKESETQRKKASK